MAMEGVRHEDCAFLDSRISLLNVLISIQSTKGVTLQITGPQAPGFPLLEPFSEQQPVHLKVHSLEIALEAETIDSLSYIYRMSRKHKSNWAYVMWILILDRFEMYLYISQRRMSGQLSCTELANSLNDWKADSEPSRGTFRIMRVSEYWSDFSC